MVQQNVRYWLGGLCLLLFAASADADLISTGARWRFLDDGSNQQTAWRAPAFNDSGWPSGASPLGFGEPVIVSTTRTGRVTYYFRHAFVVTNSVRITNLTLRVLRDDGVIVYLNGTNVFKNNLPATVSSTTVASSSVEATAYLATNVSPGLLREGTNVIAAEVHNFSTTSGDLVFDARLIGVTNTFNGNWPPSVALAEPTNNAVFPPGNIVLRANASDSDGTVALVEFFANGVKIGEDTTAPYEATWPDIAAGQYLLNAHATDNKGASTASLPIRVRVLQPPGLVRGPYLMSGSTTSVVVRWRSQAASNSRVRYGLSVDNLDQQVTVSGTRTNHEVRVTGLQPDTKYYYSVGSSTAVLGAGADYHFITSPAAPKPTRIWVIGDSGTATAQARAVWEWYRNLNGSRYTDLWLMLGDNAYQTGTDAEYQRAMFDMYPDLLRKTVVWPALGNHDGSQAYFNIFTMPTQGEAGGVPSGSEHFFSFDYGNIHFVCLDPSFSDRSSDGPMCTWLREDLLANTNEWLIAFWHQPPYTKGSHDSDDEIDLIEMRENAVPILESFGVDLVLAGHSHCYERSFLLRGHYGDSGTLTSSMILDAGSGREDGAGPYVKQSNGHGTVYVVAGSSGHATTGTMDHPAMYVSYLRMGSLILDIEGNTVQARFLRETGQIDDYFSLVKGGFSEIRFTRYQFQDGSMMLRWQANPGRRYQVEFTSDLNLSWLPISPELRAVSGNLTWTHLPLPTTRGFYRIRQLD